ncbi:hypothetical protein SBOR_5446 [Sclerotinia borealis F-4128]|uniref:Proteophosphoglycan ppg4 n=1 Tax=Sclerotinia borealis (strain F-4128) TaxID=1432307 RepID=W9CE86_SCLBF|nr:hypothetical protein SBOR_5446 [Sclerotinia borealis F-4128]
MGNGQSVQHPKRGKKLSKPKTKPTGPPLTTSNSPNPSRRNSVTGKGIIAAGASVLPHGKLLSVLETGSLEHTPEPTPTKKKRMSIFRSRSSKKDMESPQLDMNVNTVQSASPSIITGRFTRSDSVNSVTVEATEEKSWAAPNPRPSFHRSRKSLPHVPSASNNSNRLSFVPEALSPKPDSINIATGLAGQHSGEMDWQLSDPFCQRTQSNPAIYAPIRRKSLAQHGVATRPSITLNPQSFQNQIPVSYHNFERWSASPLTLRTNVDNENPGARTSTPNDLGHIGSFQLGSLRITNGSASPAPSAEERRASLPYSGSHIATLQSSSKIQGITHRSHTISVPAEAMKRPWAPTLFPQYSTENNSHDSLTIRIPDTTSPLNSSLSPTNAQSLALPPQSSPFSFVASPVGSPILEAISDDTAVDDELFEAELSTPALEPSSGNDTHSFDSGYGPSPATPEQQVLARIQGPRDMGSSLLAKTDSGYNSSTSRRNSTAPVLSTKISLRTTEAPAVPAKEPLSRSPSQTYSDVPSEDQFFNYSNGPVAHAIPMVSPESQRMTRLSKVSLPTLNYQSQIQQPIPMHHRQSMPAVPRQPQSFIVGESAKPQLEMQRQRPQSYYPGALGFAAQSRSHSEKHLPTVASYQHSERVDEVIGYTAMRRVSSKETITTIMSLEPAEVESTYNRLHNAIPPISTSIPEEDYHTGWKPPNIRRHSCAPSAPSDPSTPRNRYTLQPYHTPTSLNTYPQEDQTDFENHLTSFDTIKNSLGGSPYDLALAAMEKTPTRATQKATPAPRTKSMTPQLQSTHANLIRSQSEEPPLARPDINGHQESYNKLVGGSPFDNDGSEPNLRATSSGSTFTLRDLPSQRRTAEEDAKRSSIARTNRVGSPPPVSCQSQRKSVPVPASGQLLVPTLRSTSVERSLVQPWSSPRRKSITPPPRSHTSHAIREVTSQKSVASGQELWFDSAEQTDTSAQFQIGHSEEPSKDRSQSARPATQYHRPIPLHHFSFDVQNNSGKSSRAASVYSEKEWEIHAGAYDHTYGSSTNLHEHPVNVSGNEYDATYFEEPQPVPQRGSSTQDMLVLDRYAGSLGYGFEPDYGLGGSAGTRDGGMMNKGGRKGVDVSKEWGLDFSDVPIIMQRERE